MLRIIILLIITLANGYAIACSCNLGSVDKKFNEAYSVFIGKVREIIIQDKENRFGEQSILVTLSIEQSFKNAKKSITLDTFNNRVSCEGYWFKEKHEYLVYAYEKAGRLSVLYCGGVLPKDSKQCSAFLKELNQLKQLKDQSYDKPLKNCPKVQKTAPFFSEN